MLANPITSVPASTPEGKPIVIYLGDDQEGRPLEVGVMEREPDEADLVLHVMDLRAKYRPYYEAGKEEEEP